MPRARPKEPKEDKLALGEEVTTRAGERRRLKLPDGSVLFAEVYSAKLDADNNPRKGADGFFEPDKLVRYTAMARDTGWGKDIPELIRNENCNYAVFTADQKYQAGVNQAECLACHKPLANVSYTFTLKELSGTK